MNYLKHFEPVTIRIHTHAMLNPELTCIDIEMEILKMAAVYTFEGVVQASSGISFPVSMVTCQRFHESFMSVMCGTDFTLMTIDAML